MKKILKIIILLAITGAAIVWGSRFIESDRCLDNGGRWNNEQNVCEK